MKKVVAGFTFEGTYSGLKRFLSVVERSPKFLTLERIDFLNTGSETGALQLKIELAAYYAM
jgi:Tfp pilus assembly protein PilO